MDEDSDEDEEDEEDEEGAEDEEEESDEHEDEEEETGRLKLLSHPLPDGSKGSIITCCPRILRGSCSLDRNLPRLPCGHFAIPTRDVAIQGMYYVLLKPIDLGLLAPPGSKGQFRKLNGEFFAARLYKHLITVNRPLYFQRGFCLCSWNSVCFL